MMLSYIIRYMESGIIFDIKKFSIHDGPGIRTTVFLKGCPLSCWWCHNPESQRICREKLYAVSRCVGCGECLAACPENAIREMETGLFTDPDKCLQCGSCADVCLAEACEMAGRELTVSQVMAEIEKDTAFYDESCRRGDLFRRRAAGAAGVSFCAAESLQGSQDSYGAGYQRVFDLERAGHVSGITWMYFCLT